MEDELLTIESLQKRIKQLEHERNELRKDIEQLCMQQAGPSYLGIATRMHFQRTAGLEQEIEIMKEKLAVGLREKQNLQEELTEAYRIKTQLADLLNVEVLKNKVAEDQLKFFQSCVATAFSERDHSLLELEKAKDGEEAISEELNISHRRVEELESAYCSVKERHDSLVNELGELKEQIEPFEKVINKFYAIRERDAGPSAGHTWKSRCLCLLDDSSDKWIFNSNSRSTTSIYIASLEEEIASRKQAMEKLQNNLRMGLQIEQHLKRRVQFLEKKQMQLIEMFENGLSSLHHIYNQQKEDVVTILEEERSHLDEVLLEVNEKVLLAQLKSEQKHEYFQEEAEHLSDDSECKDVHVTDDVDLSFSMKGADIFSCVISSKADNSSDALSQALEEKVAALMLLSQQEERHFLERETNAALHQKLEELRRNLSQVTIEKIEALMELAQLKREYELLQESINLGPDATLTKFLKKSSFLRWVGKNKACNESSVVVNENYSMDFARLKVDYAALQEIIANMEHLTTTVHRLHVSLLKDQSRQYLTYLYCNNKPHTVFKMVQVSADAENLGSSGSMEPFNNIIAEANQVKTALASSRFSDSTSNTLTYQNLRDTAVSSSEQRSDRVVSAAGLEMIELLILAAQFFKEKTPQNTSTCS